MKVRISGPPDLVRAWAAQFETHLGIKGREYPNRNSADIRYFLDLDDRVAAEVLGLVGTAQPCSPATESVKWRSHL